MRHHGQRRGGLERRREAAREVVGGQEDQREEQPDVEDAEHDRPPPPVAARQPTLEGEKEQARGERADQGREEGPVRGQELLGDQVRRAPGDRGDGRGEEGADRSSFHGRYITFRVRYCPGMSTDRSRPRGPDHGAVGRRATRPRRQPDGADRPAAPARRSPERRAAPGVRRGRARRRRLRRARRAAPVRPAVRADAGGARHHHDGHLGRDHQADRPARARRPGHPDGERHRRAGPAGWRSAPRAAGSSTSWSRSTSPTSTGWCPGSPSGSGTSWPGSWRRGAGPWTSSGAGPRGAVGDPANCRGRAATSVGALVQRADLGDLVWGQREVEEVEVLPHPLLVRGLREDDVAALEVPAEGDLRRRPAAVPRRSSSTTGSSSTSPRAIGDHASTAAPCRSVAARRRLVGEVGVHLDLVHRRYDAGLLDDPVEVVRLEVRDAHGPGPAVLHELGERAPRGDVVAVVQRRQRPVDEEQVDPVEPEPLRLSSNARRASSGRCRPLSSLVVM